MTLRFPTTNWPAQGLGAQEKTMKDPEVLDPANDDEADSAANRHHCFELEELRRYQVAQQQQSENALQDLTKLSEELGLEL